MDWLFRRDAERPITVGEVISLSSSYEPRIGYAAYPHLSKPSETSYGVSMWKPSRVVEMAMDVNDMRVLSYGERVWDFQDILVLGACSERRGRST